MEATIPPLNAPSLLAPFLPALPAAAASHEPAIGILPLLSPILRQRVQLLAAASTEPWLRLLCYDTSKAARLADVVRSEGLEPHPVSGEVEIDWDYDAETRYRRPDEETLQALVVLGELGLAFHAVWCVNDPEGGADGWRVGEVTVVEKPSPFARFGGAKSLDEAERLFKDGNQAKAPTPSQLGVPGTNGSTANADEDEEDDGYWDRYDATPARTPAEGRSPAPPPASTMEQQQQQPGSYRTASAEDHYYAQYDDVQPAMDNHDPDEAAQQAHMYPPLGAALGASKTLQQPIVQPSTNGTAAPRSGLTFAQIQEANQNSNSNNSTSGGGILHPRPESSASSTGSHTVARLEETAGKQEQNEFGVKQHVSRSIRSLYQLSRASGIDREEFERLVKTELDILGMVEES